MWTVKSNPFDKTAANLSSPKVHTRYGAHPDSYSLVTAR